MKEQKTDTSASVLAGAFGNGLCLFLGFLQVNLFIKLKCPCDNESEYFYFGSLDPNLKYLSSRMC